MMLFDEITRSGLDTMRSNKSDFEYLNRIARPEVEAVAGLMEEWFGRCPAECQADIRGRIRDKREVQFHSAFFELFLMEFLRALGCEFVTHPDMPEASTHPDFLVYPESGESFYLEAASVNPAAADAREGRFKSQVLEQIDRIQDSRFHLVARDSGVLSEQPSGRRIRNNVESWLRELDSKVVDAAASGACNAADAEIEIRVGEWVLTVRAWPATEKGQRVGFVGAPKTTADHETIRSASESKGPRYGILDRPYVVALNLGPVIFSSDYSVHTAIFGPERIQLRRTVDGGVEHGGAYRSGPGAFFDGNGPKNTRVSALLVAHRLRPDTLRSAHIALFHNPWALVPYDSCLTRLNQHIAEEDEYRQIPGIDVGGLLEFPAEYP